MDYFNILKDANLIAIAGHTSPDGDCVGACFAMAMALDKLGKKASVLMDDIPRKFRVIPGREFLYTGSADTLKPDLFIALDCGDRERLGRFAPVFDISRTTFCADHHISNKGFAEHNLIEPGASSTCEVVYNLIAGHIPLDRKIASALYAGIVDDTGGFCHNSTSADVHEIAAKLINQGIPFNDIHNEIKNIHSANEVIGLKTAIENMVILADRGIAYSVVAAEEMEKAGISYTDFEGIAEYLVNIRGIDLSFFVYEKPDGCRISLRSKKTDVSSVAAKLGGGGHALAAGATVTAAADQAADMVLRAIG
jgi:phosphoesterase RecJ-like protein